MILIPVQTGLISTEQELICSIREAGVQATDIVVLSSKVVAHIEGTMIDLSALHITDTAHEFAKRIQRTPAFCQAVLNEIDRLNGCIVGTCPGAVLTELRPEGLPQGVILCANAGLDQSNAPQGHAIGWPNNPVESAKRLRKALGCAICIADSCCRPRRWGVTAFALAVAGFDPLLPQKGIQDLYGRTLRITQEATADQLATAAGLLMGNAAQAVPAVIVRESKIQPSNFAGWVPSIEPSEDLFAGIV